MIQKVRNLLKWTGPKKTSAPMEASWCVCCFAGVSLWTQMLFLGHCRTADCVHMNNIHHFCLKEGQFWPWMHVLICAFVLFLQAKIKCRKKYLHKVQKPYLYNITASWRTLAICSVLVLEHGIIISCESDLNNNLR